MNIEKLQPNQTSPTEKEHAPLTLSRVHAEARDDIAAYYQFEIDQGFSQIHPKATFDSMVNFRQQQIKDNKLEVVIAREGDEVAATTTVVLENGTMGKEINGDEAWASGTVVAPDKRGGGIGARMSQEQDAIAKAAGKKSMLTTIATTNYPSMRLRLNVGYRLGGIDRRDNETNYLYRKDLDVQTAADQDWKQEVQAGKLKLAEILNDAWPETVLIDPQDTPGVENALTNGYEGVHLLRPEDFEDPRPIDKNLLVFVKKSNEKST